MEYFRQRDTNVQVRIDRVMKDLPEFCKHFTLYCNAKLTKLTACGYLYEIRKFLQFMGERRNAEYMNFTTIDLNSVTTLDVESWLSTCIGIVGDASINRKYSSVRTFLEFYFTRKFISQNVADVILLPKVTEKPITRLTLKEVGRLLNAVDEAGHRHALRDKTILIFFLSTGVRASELVGLDIKHVDIENASFTVRRKGGKIEKLYMTEELQIQLMYYMDSIDTSNEDAPFFPSEDNPRLAYNSVRLLLCKYIELAGIEKRITPHKLRSTFGTNLYRKTRDIFAVAQCLGNSSVNTTRKHYAALDEDIKREAVRGYSMTAA